MTRSLLFEPKPWLELIQPRHSHYRASKHPPPTPAPERSTTAGNAPARRQDDALEDDEPSIPETTLFSLPSEVIHYILSTLEAEQFSALAQASSAFLPYVYDPRHWRHLALRQWPDETRAQLETRLYEYKSWRKLCTLRPRLRTHGVYVVRHQFTKTSARLATEEPEAPVFMVTYFRYLRFYTDGTVISLTSPDAPHVAYRRIRRTYWPAQGEKEKTAPSIGRYEFDEGNQQVNVTLPMDVVRFPGMRTGTVHMHMTLASTKEGACDRLIPTSHYSMMNDDGGVLVPYQVNNKPLRFISIWGFRTNVYKEFPPDDARDLAQWFEMKKAARAFQNNQRHGRMSSS